MWSIDELAANSVHYRQAALGRESLMIKRTVMSGLAGICATLEKAVSECDCEKAVRALEGYQRYLRDLNEEDRVRGWVSRLLELEAELRDQDLRFFLHELQYVLDFHSGETAAAMAHVDVLFNIARGSGNHLHFARAYVAVCRLDLRNEDAAALEDHAARLMGHADAAGDDYFRAFSHHMVANLREMEGDAGKAVECYVKSSDLFKKCGADYMVHTESFNLAACALDLNELAAARRAFSDFAELTDQLEDAHLVPELLSCLSLLLLKEDDADTAAQLMGASEAALLSQARQLYPAEEKISASTVASLREILGEESFEHQLDKGRKLDPAAALNLAGLAQA